MWILILLVAGMQPQFYVTPFKTEAACAAQLKISDAQFSKLYPGVPHQLKCVPGKKK